VSVESHAREHEVAPARPGRFAHTWRFPVGIVLLLGFVWITLAVLFSGPMVSLDHRIDDWVVANLPHPVIVVFRRYVVLPGQRLYNVPPMAILAAILAWRRKQWRPLLVPMAVMIFMAIFVPGLKLWTGRTNPISGGDHLWSGGTEYPSGHEMNAIVVWGMTFALAACLDWPVGRWLTRRRRAVLVTLMALLIGVSVIIARTHWMTDVIASIFFGIPLLWVTLRVGFTKPRPAQEVTATPSESAPTTFGEPGS
jgi:undecaprenyl-diphosphatase